MKPSVLMYSLRVIAVHLSIQNVRPAAHMEEQKSWLVFRHIRPEHHACLNFPTVTWHLGSHSSAPIHP